MHLADMRRAVFAYWVIDPAQLIWTQLARDGVSQILLYQLRDRVLQAIGEALSPRQAGRPAQTTTLEVDKALIDRTIAALSLLKGSVRDIRLGLALILGVTCSVGYISETLTTAGERAADYHLQFSVPLPILGKAEVRQPCLTLVDGRSFLVVSLTPTDACDAIPWGVTYLDAVQLQEVRSVLESIMPSLRLSTVAQATAEAAITLSRELYQPRDGHPGVPSCCRAHGVGGLGVVSPLLQLGRRRCTVSCVPICRSPGHVQVVASFASTLLEPPPFRAQQARRTLSVGTRRSEGGTLAGRGIKQPVPLRGGGPASLIFLEVPKVSTYFCYTSICCPLCRPKRTGTSFGSSGSGRDGRWLVARTPIFMVLKPPPCQG